MALNLDGIIWCCPLVAPSSFPYASSDCMQTDWGYELQPKRQIFDLLCSSPEEQEALSLPADDGQGMVRSDMEVDSLAWDKAGARTERADNCISKGD
jgi:hypothetical protein